jgi:hypothetical protein
MIGTFERVYTVYQYHDGPRSGIADFGGKPHFFEWIWDNDTDDYGSSCILQSIADEAFQLAIEDWEMWVRWKTAFDEGRVVIQSPWEEHPVLPEDEVRYKEIAPFLKMLKRERSDDQSQQFMAIGIFKRLSETGATDSAGPWQVSWAPC